MARSTDYFDRVTKGLEEALVASRSEADPERAVRHFTRITRQVLGDPEAPAKPGALKPGETQFTCSGIFFLAPARDHMTLLADHGFPANQRLARISSKDSRPGNTVQTGIPAVVPDTDVDPIFRQILASGRVGSSVYVPMHWQGQVIGMFNTAAQARSMYDETDMRMQVLFAGMAAVTWMALGGPAYLAGVSANLPPWKPS